MAEMITVYTLQMRRDCGRYGISTTGNQGDEDEPYSCYNDNVTVEEGCC